jgi:hypothetical protein
MEHFLATRVSLPASPGRMHIHSATGISYNGALVGDDGLCTNVTEADAYSFD